MILRTIFKYRFVRLLYVIFGIVVIINVARSVYALWKKQDIIGEKEHTLQELKKEAKELEARYEYVQSDGFIEKEAREKLNLGKEGETVIIVPDENAAEPDVDASVEDQENTSAFVQNESNFTKWMRLFGIANNHEL